MVGPSDEDVRHPEEMNRICESSTFPSPAIAVVSVSVMPVVMPTQHLFCFCVSLYAWGLTSGRHPALNQGKCVGKSVGSEWAARG